MKTALQVKADRTNELLYLLEIYSLKKLINFWTLMIFHIVVKILSYNQEGWWAITLWNKTSVNSGSVCELRRDKRSVVNDKENTVIKIEIKSRK